MSQEISEEALEKWFEDDDRLHPFEHDVNEGKLEFLPVKPNKPILHSRNTLTISRQSMKDGWVDLHQCYDNLDAVPDAQVVYKYKNMRNLRIASVSKIEKAWIEGQSVQLQNTEKGAKLCIAAQVQILYKQSGRTYLLKNGPFQRKFLDGYYPMQVTLKVKYPEANLIYQKVEPVPQKGFAISHNTGFLLVEAVFEGMLFTKIYFQNHK